MGEHGIHVHVGNEQFFTAAKVIKHPSFTRKTLNNDIMLIKRAYLVTLNAQVKTVALTTSCAPVGTHNLFSGRGNPSALVVGRTCHLLLCFLCTLQSPPPKCVPLASRLHTHCRCTVHTWYETHRREMCTTNELSTPPTSPPTVSSLSCCLGILISILFLSTQSMI